MQIQIKHSTISQGKHKPIAHIIEGNSPIRVWPGHSQASPGVPGILLATLAALYLTLVNR